MPSETFFPLSVYIWLEADRFRVTSLRDGGIGFLVLRFWPFLDRFFGFCTQKLRFFGFVVHCGWRIFRFLTFGFRFPRKILTGFQIWYPIRFPVFPYLTYLGSGFSSIWAAITRLHWSRIAAKGKCYGEECMTNQLKYRRDPYVACAQQYPPPPQKWGGGGRVRPHLGYG